MFMTNIMINSLTAMKNAAVPLFMKFNGMHYTSM